MRKINENYVYKEPEEITIQRNKIHKNQRNIEDLQILLERYAYSEISGTSILI